MYTNCTSVCSLSSVNFYVPNKKPSTYLHKHICIPDMEKKLDRNLKRKNTHNCIRSEDKILTLYGKTSLNISKNVSFHQKEV